MEAEVEEVEEADQEEKEVVVEKEEEEVVVEKEKGQEEEEEEEEEEEGVALEIQEDARTKKDTEWMGQRRCERCMGQLEICQMVREERYLQ